MTVIRHPPSLPHPGPLFLFLLLLTLLPSPTLATTETHVRLLSLPTLSNKNEEVARHSARFNGFPNSPISSSTCGYARVTEVGISVNKGARAVLRYKIRVKAVTAEKLAFADSPFFAAIPEHLRSRYLSMRKEYSGGLDVPFLNFLGVDLSKPMGKGKKGDFLSDDDYDRLSSEARKIMRSSTKTVIKVKGKLRATGISCMKTTAFAFVKLAKVKLNDGDSLTVLTSKNEEVIAATKHADTILPSKGGLKLLKF